MSELQQKTIIDPDLSDVLALQKLDVFSSLNCVKVGQITAFDATKKTATVQILFKRILPDGTSLSYKPLLDCPVFTLQGGGGYVQMPIAAGDQCIVLFSDRNLDAWYQNGSQSIPMSARMHDMSDAIVIVGLNPLNNSGPVNPSDKVVISYQGTSLQLSSVGVSFLGTGGAEIDMDAGIITIKNMTTTLLMLLSGLIDVIESIQVNGPIPLTGASVAALEAYKVILAGLLG